MELSNATLTTQGGFESSSPDLTLSIDRGVFEEVILGKATPADLISSGKATIDGDASGLLALFDALADFHLLFEILPGTSSG